MANDTKVAWIGVLGAILGAVATVCVGKAFPDKPAPPPNIYTSFVVPPSTTRETSVLPTESSAGDDYTLIKDISIFDLRQWRPTPDSIQQVRRWCPVNYTNYLHIKKTHEMDSLVIHYGTTGYTIDMRCVTNKYTFYAAKSNKFKDVGALKKQFALNIYIKDIPLNTEFLIVIEATYWNGFSNESKESAITYTDLEIHGLDEFGLVILFPITKPFKNELRYFDRPNTSNVEQPFDGLNRIYKDEKRNFVYWDIKSREPNHNYRLEWDW